MIELEKTYLAKMLPGGLSGCKHKEIVDVYFPESVAHPVMRLRKIGDVFEITKKEPVNGTDSSHQEEQTIKLTELEFTELNQQIAGKRLSKIRYEYKYQNHTALFDIFLNELAGLVLIDFEFNSLKDKDAFVMPSFCLADVTQDKFMAGGELAGKKYNDIEKDLKTLNYKKLFL